MNIEKWTMTMRNALQNAISRVIASSRQCVEIEDIFIELLEDQNGIFYRILVKLNKDTNQVYEYFKNVLSQLSIVNNVSEENIRLSYDLNQLIFKANTICSEYKDDYLSVEHFVLALFSSQSYSIKQFIDGNILFGTGSNLSKILNLSDNMKYIARTVIIIFIKYIGIDFNVVIRFVTIFFNSFNYISSSC